LTSEKTDSLTAEVRRDAEKTTKRTGLFPGVLCVSADLCGEPFFVVLAADLIVR
jgi:hypothetical protein